MKIDLTVRSAVFEEVFLRIQDSSGGALPYRVLKQHWAAIRLRESDLAEVIEHLQRRGQLRLDSRQDGLWIGRVYGAPKSRNPLRWLHRRWHSIRISHAVERVLGRSEKFYAGMDRRLGI